MTPSMWDWLGQSAVAATLVGLVVYLFRNLIATRLAKSVQHEFDTKLAAFKTELERAAKLQESVRSAAFAAQLSQRGALATKRIEAAQGLWNGVLEARKGVPLALNVELLKVTEVAKRVHDPKMQEFLTVLAQGDAMTSEYSTRIGSVAVHRPFVPARAWAIFAVYTAIIAHSIAIMKTLQLGQDPAKFLTTQHWSGLVADALPGDELSKVGTSGNYRLQWVFGRLEFHILEELRQSLSEHAVGLDSLESAQRIVDAAERLRESGTRNKPSEKQAEFPELFRSRSPLSPE